MTETPVRTSLGAGTRARRLLERIPLGVPLGAAAASVALFAGDAIGLVPDAIAWGVGGALALSAEMYGLYLGAAWWRGRVARRAAAADLDAGAPARLFDPLDEESGPALPASHARASPARLLPP